MKKNLTLVFMLIIVSTIGTSLMAQDYSGGSGTTGDPYQIANKTDLKYLSENTNEWDNHYIQTANIVFVPEDFQTGGDFYNSGAGFIPIGNSLTRFTGTYNGDEHTIDNLFINRSSTDNIGLFGKIKPTTTTTTVSNLGVINININGQNNVGGLIGYNDAGSTVSNCYSTGEVVGGQVVGGLMGDNRATLGNCYSTASVSGTKNCGGLVGYNRGATVSNCYSKGNVNRSSGSESNFAGFCGFNHTSTIENCYSTGSVSYAGATNPTNKGFVGYHASGTYTNNFWDIGASNQTTATGATGKSTTEMKNVETFTDENVVGLTTAWDFETNPNDDDANNDYWDIDGTDTINNGYPFLSWQNGDDIALPVTLSSFTASLYNVIPQLQWTTQSEQENLGWNVYRSSSLNFGQGILLTSDLIEGAGTVSHPTDYTFNDPLSIEGGRIYGYWLESISYSGESELFGPVALTVPYGIENHGTPIATRIFGLYQNYPNPFNPTTEISFALEEAGNCELSIYDVKGRKIKTLFTGNIEAEQVYSFVWNREDESEKAVASGIYFYKLETLSYSKVNKMLLLK